MSSSSSIASFIKEFYPEYWGDQTYPISSSVVLLIDGDRFNVSNKITPSSKRAHSSIEVSKCHSSKRLPSKVQQEPTPLPIIIMIE